MINIIDKFVLGCLFLVILYGIYVLIKCEIAYKFLMEWSGLIHKYRLICIKEDIEPQVNYSDLKDINIMSHNLFKGYNLYDYIDNDKRKIVMDTIQRVKEKKKENK